MNRGFDRKVLTRMHIELVAITPDAEAVIEQAGRTCYQSISRTKPGSEKDFIRKIIESGHHSVLEHAYATFRIKNCSRAMTHQLVRHRLCAFSQQSQRFVDEESFSYVVPENIAAEYLEEFQRDMETIQQMYRKWRHKGLRKEDARFVLPNACASEIIVSANFRQWRHIFCVRCSRHAQWEIRAAALEMLRIMKRQAPTVFEDFSINDELMIACTKFDS